MLGNLIEHGREPDEPIPDLVCSGLPADNQVPLTEEFAEYYIEQGSLQSVLHSQAFAKCLGSVS
jgi:hypothetical protein